MLGGASLVVAIELGGQRRLRRYRQLRCTLSNPNADRRVWSPGVPVGNFFRTARTVYRCAAVLAATSMSVIDARRFRLPGRLPPSIIPYGCHRLHRDDRRHRHPQRRRCAVPHLDVAVGTRRATSSAPAAERAATSTTKAPSTRCARRWRPAAPTRSAPSTPTSRRSTATATWRPPSSRRRPQQQRRQRREDALRSGHRGPARCADRLGDGVRGRPPPRSPPMPRRADFNTAVDQVNTTRKRALELRDATYR